MPVGLKRCFFFKRVTIRYRTGTGRLPQTYEWMAAPRYYCTKYKSDPSCWKGLDECFMALHRTCNDRQPVGPVQLRMHLSSFHEQQQLPCNNNTNRERKRGEKKKNEKERRRKRYVSCCAIGLHPGRWMR